MTSLTGYLSSDYQKAINFLSPKSTPKTVFVQVEGIDDVSFWFDILNYCQGQGKVKFDVQPYSNNSLETGKERLRKLFSQTGEYFIICLDSDYDYLFPEYSDVSKAINKNKHIFQTYAYSIENLKCYAESLASVCVKTTNNTKETINFTELLRQYSKTIYNLFIWNLYFYSIKDTNTFTIDKFCGEIKIKKSPDIDNNYTVLRDLEECVQIKLAQLENDFPDIKKDIDAFAKQFEKSGLNETNAYLFIQGHVLYENFVLMFIKSICRKLKHERINQIKESGIHKEEIINHLNHYQSLVGKVDENVRIHLSTNDKFKECFLFENIEDDIKRYFELYL
ncbi:MAG: DUF4435 domain-containing protein [Methylobacter sp.]